MKHLVCLLLLLLPLRAVFAQEPRIVWGPAIDKNPLELQKMEVIGSPDGKSFYSFFVEDGQATLERYNENNQRVWATALFPKSPSSQPTTFADVILLQDKLYLVSTFRAKSTTTVFAQEISATGNYGASVLPILNAQGNGKLHLAVSEDKSALLVALHDTGNSTVSASLLTSGLQTRWSQRFTLPGTMQQLLLQNNGTSFILSNAPAKAKTPYLLHRLAAQDGKAEQLSLATPEQHWPVQAMLAATNQGLVMTGFYAAASEASEEKPEPRGTFYHLFSNAGGSNSVAAYTPFNSVFLREYKRYKPDTDKMQRLRNLQLRQVIALPSGGVILIGEETFVETLKGIRTMHKEDIIIARLDAAGAVVYNTSSNKLQSTTGQDDQLSSFTAIPDNDTLHLLYLDFEYNYTPENTIIMAGEGAIEKMPVLVTIPPAGRPLQVTPMHHSQTGRSANFYLRPTAAFPLNENEVILLSVGKQHYKYGRLKLQ